MANGSDEHKCPICSHKMIWYVDTLLCPLCDWKEIYILRYDRDVKKGDIK